MNTGFRAVLYGLGALALSVGVILSTSTLGLSPATRPSISPGTPGVLSILLTDPPSVPEGVTAIYLGYSNLALHASGFPADSGLVKLGARGTIDTMSLINTSLTISTENVPTGEYDFLVFKLSGVSVTFQGKNYTTTSSNGTLVTPIIGRLTVNGSGTNAVLVDIQPSVINVGSTQNPRFVMTTGARALQVPPKEVQPMFNQVGHKEPLQAKEWYDSFSARHADVISIGAASLTPHSFSLTLVNPTSDSLPIRAIVLTPDGRNAHTTLTPQSLADSTIFVVNGNGSLRLVQLDLSRRDSGRNLVDIFSGSAYQLGSNSSSTFSFTGSVMASFSSGLEVRSGSVCYVSVVGNQVITLGTVTSG